MWKLLLHPVSALIITMVAVLFSLSLYKSTQDIRSSQAGLDQLEGEIAQLGSEVQSVQAEMQQADSPLVKEKIIRNELLMQKPGEYVIQIPEVIEEPGAVLPESSDTQPWQEWQQLLF